MSEHTIAHTTVDGLAAVTLGAPNGGLTATFVPSAGMVGCSLRAGDAELLGQRRGLGAYVDQGKTFGIPLLYPWANRLAGFDYAAAGERVHLEERNPLLHADPNGLPMHGLLAASPHWEVTADGALAGSARLSARLDWTRHTRLMAAFPYPHEAAIDVTLAGDRLTIATAVHATGTAPVPVAFGFHPYLTLPGVPRAEWSVELPVRAHALTDDLQIPTGATEPAGDLDGPLGERTFDDGYVELEPDPVFALEGGGRRIEVAFDAGYPCAQVYAPEGDDLICFEPMTAPTNALISGDRLPVVEPGESFRAVFSIRVLSVG